MQDCRIIYVRRSVEEPAGSRRRTGDESRQNNSCSVPKARFICIPNFSLGASKLGKDDCTFFVTGKFPEVFFLKTQRVQKDSQTLDDALPEMIHLHLCKSAIALLQNRDEKKILTQKVSPVGVLSPFVAQSMNLSHPLALSCRSRKSRIAFQEVHLIMQIG